MRRKISAEERAARKVYLALLNDAVVLSREILRGSQRPGWLGPAMRDGHAKLEAQGKITSLKQVAQVEAVGWALADAPGPVPGDHQDAFLREVGVALASVSEWYASREPIDEGALARAREHIASLERLLQRR